MRCQRTNCKVRTIRGQIVRYQTSETNGVVWDVRRQKARYETSEDKLWGTRWCMRTNCKICAIRTASEVPDVRDKWCGMGRQKTKGEVWDVRGQIVRYKMSEDKWWGTRRHRTNDEVQEVRGQMVRYEKSQDKWWGTRCQRSNEFQGYIRDACAVIDFLSMKQKL